MAGYAKNLSKSKLLSGNQCAKRLYLEVYRPELLKIDAETQQRFTMGHDVGAEARRQWKGGVLIGHDADLASALAETQGLLGKPGPVTLFEGTLSAKGVLVRTDILSRTKKGMRLVEVKASTSVKDYHLLDAAIQVWVCEQAGIGLDEVHLAHIDREFVYQGDGDYDGLFRYVDIRPQIEPLIEHVPKLVSKMRKMLSGDEPQIEVGPHCTEPFECPFLSYCTPPQPEYPVTLLPYGGKTVTGLLADGYRDLRDVPGNRLTNPNHQRIWRLTRSGEPEVLPGAKEELETFQYPRYYMDFETVQFPIPIWKGTRPYETLPFQWSVHIELRRGKVVHKEFLAMDDKPPMTRFCDSLLDSVGTMGPIFVYNAGFESRVLKELADRIPAKRTSINAVIDRIVDLLPITRKYYYHPSMRGSWSMKAVAPAIDPELSYKNLGDVQDSGAAPRAFLEIIDPSVNDARRSQLVEDLRRYCALDTNAMVKLVEYMSGQKVGG